MQPILPVLLLVLLILLAYAVNPIRLWTIRAELQNNADADSFAAMQIFVNDDRLRALLDNDPQVMPAIITAARNQALLTATWNPVNGTQFSLLDNPLNDPNGDIVFGSIPNALSKQFTVATNIQDDSNMDLLSVNTVRINARLLKSRGTAPAAIFPELTGYFSQDIIARSSTTLDNHVVGFRHTIDNQLPIAPLALLGDYTLNPDQKTWNFQVEKKGGTDGDGDGLFEFTAKLATANGQMDTNTVLLLIGTSTASEINAQLTSGVAKTDLATFGGQLILNDQCELEIDGFDSLDENTQSTELSDLHASLETLRDSKESRIWPIYNDFDAGTAKVIGFVAARVVSVDPLNLGSPLTFSLEPTMVANNAALTDATRNCGNNNPIVNPYICKIRLVE